MIAFHEFMARITINIAMMFERWSFYHHEKTPCEKCDAIKQEDTKYIEEILDASGNKVFPIGYIIANFKKKLN